MTIAGYVLMKRLVFCLMDEVWDDGSSLIVRNKGKEVCVRYADIRNVSYSPFMNPPHVTLSVRRETEFGSELTFSAPICLVPLRKHRDIAELIDRIDQARG